MEIILILVVIVAAAYFLITYRIRVNSEKSTMELMTQMMLEDSRKDLNPDQLLMVKHNNNEYMTDAEYIVTPEGQKELGDMMAKIRRDYKAKMKPKPRFEE